MKRKIYFIVSGVINIIVSIYTIIVANELVNQLLDSVTGYPEELQERITSIYQNSGPTYISVLASICIILNIIIIVLAIKNKILPKKGLIIAFSIISIFTASINIVELLSIINIIVLAFSKRVNPEDYPEKKEIPKLKVEKVDAWGIVASAFLLVIYFSQFIWQSFVPEAYSLYVGLGFYVLLIILCIYCFKETLKRDFKEFRHNLEAYLSYIFPKLGIFYVIYVVVALAAIIIAGGMANNQTNIESLPLYISIPLAVIYAPIVEECLFRGVLRRFIKKDTLFIIVSGIVFGLLHTFSSETSLFRMIVLAFPYGIMGAYLAYIYVKTNNMCSNMFSHAFHNSLAMILSILMMGI